MSYKNIHFYPHTYKIINQHFNLKGEYYYDEQRR